MEEAVVTGITVVAGSFLHEGETASWGIVLPGLAGVLLAWRRKWPVAVLEAVLALTLAYWLAGFPGGPVWLPLTVAFFSAPYGGHRLAAVLTLAAGWIAFAFVSPLARGDDITAVDGTPVNCHNSVVNMIRDRKPGADVALTYHAHDGQNVAQAIRASGRRAVAFELDGAAQDGSYTYELRGVPRLDASVRRELAAARKAGNEAAVTARLQAAGKLPRESAVQSGAFLVQDGAIVPGDREERGPKGKPAGSGIGVITAEDQVIRAR